MFFSDQFVDEIRQRILTSDVVRRHVNLQQKGKEFLGLCPFHNEKTPSFTVSDQKGFYHCFGCGAHGDIVKFVMEKEGLSFPETIEQLANQAGLELPKQTEQQRQITDRLTVLYRVCELTSQWFCQQLNQLPQHHPIQHYLQQRGITASQKSQFSIGYAPDSYDALIEYLHRQGVTDEHVIQTGLGLTSKKGTLYSRFRNRIMFPICDGKGRVIAFGGRIVGDGQPKYLNSPETDIFKKRYTAYNMHTARQQSFDHKKLVIVEGYMDVIALSAIGVDYAVAPLGTALTTDHLTLLWKYASSPILCFDGDNAGRKAAIRAALAALPSVNAGRSLSFILLPKGLDPDDYAKQHGRSGWNNLEEHAVSLSQLLWEHEYNDKPLKTPEQRADLAARLDTLTGQIQDNETARQYRDFFKQALWKMKIESPYFKSKSSVDKLSAHNLPVDSDHPVTILEKELIKLVVDHPELLEQQDVYEEFIDIEFSLNELDKIRQIILEGVDIKHLKKSEDLYTFVNAQLGETRNTWLAANNNTNDIVGNSVHFSEIWRYIYYRYVFERLKHEYEHTCSLLTVESDKKATMLYNEMCRVEVRLKQYNNLFSSDMV